MTNIDRNQPVLVTGATGYVAGVLVQRLLEQGLTVHAAVRDPDNREKLRFLDAIAERSPGQIRYFRSDLLESGSYDAAMAGCELVFHTASPFKLDVKDAQRDLVDPARLGTRNVLESANRCASVRRVVLTSSCAAIFGDNADLQSVPEGLFTEAHWNRSSSLTHNPYSYSKTVAEQEAWSMAEAQSQWDLVVINPSLVIGPGINPQASSESYQLVKQMGDGSLKTGMPRFGVGAVDVRDVAEAHLQAGFNPAAKGRYIVSGHNTDFLDLARCLLDRYGREYPIPRRAMPKWLVWLLGPLVDKALTRRSVARNVNLPWRADNRRSIEELGLEYRPLQQSMLEFFEHLLEGGLIKRASQARR